MLNIHLLGGLRLTYQGQPYKFSALPKTMPLFAYLLLHAGGPLSRPALAYTIWPDTSEDIARSNLRRHLYELRRVLPTVSEERSWVLVDANTVRWNPSADYWLDSQAFVTFSADPEKLPDAITLYRGDLLPEMHEDWLVFERERLRNLYLADLMQLVARQRAQGDLSAAIAYASEFLQHDPLNEEMLRHLMSICEQAGDFARAMLVYRDFEQRLRIDLNVTPMVETNSLYDVIARKLLLQHNPEPFPASQTAQVPIVVPTPQLPAKAEPAVARSNLPAQLTSFIGRGAEMAALRTLFGRGDAQVRLLTLTGPGGCGKTRLAIEVAALLANDSEVCPDGVFFVTLAALTEPALVANAIASALGLVAQDNRPLKMQLISALGNRRLLLVLDNFEQVSSAAQLVVDLLTAAPGLRVLITSRVVLRVYGEHEYPVAPFQLPDLADEPSLDQLMQNPAIELFVTRSRAANPGFVLRRSEVLTIAEICVRLDGLPLAIELAAARSKFFAPQALLARLVNRLDVLEDRLRRTEWRHKTLRATLDWSYQLLGVLEQRMFARVAVFAQSFSLEAVEAICAEDGVDVLSSISHLCDNSLLQTAQIDHEVRLVMLATVHQYASTLLSPQEREFWQNRHAAYFMDFALRAERQIYGEQQASWLAKIRQEEDNLRAALRWSLAAEASDGRAVYGLRIVKALARYWQIIGRIAEGRAWFTQAAAVRSGAPIGAQVEMLGQSGLFAQLQGDFDAAFEQHEEALRLARMQDDETLLAFALYSLGTALGRSGNYPRSRDMLVECLDLRRRLYPSTVTSAQLALTLNNLASTYRYLGEGEKARSLLEESLVLKRASGDKVAVATALANLGDLACAQGDIAQADLFQRESMELRISMGDQLGLTKALDQMAELAVHREDWRRAATLFAAATAAYSAIHSQRSPGVNAEYEDYMAKLHVMLTSDAMEAATVLGQRMTIDDAVRFALS